ncbi:hypothetical protein D1BOALGB6SA_10298 [Olavius sp. associated proteobacterium Delta 1]|nr:hypothetical protein D1BOALGB6SA_10298 [Olavius sp. associated proteobacterium Delta 1]
MTHHKIVLAVALLFIIPITSMAGTIDVMIKGRDDGIKTNKQQDYKEALMNAKLEAIERAGVKISSMTKIVNFEAKYDVVRSKAEAVLLPGFTVMDIGYQSDGTYLVVLSGKVRSGKAANPKVNIPQTLYQKWKAGKLTYQTSQNTGGNPGNSGGTTEYTTWKNGKKVNTTYVNTTQNYVSNRDLQGKSFDQLMFEAFEAYENEAYAYAERVFSHASRSRPGNVEANVWSVKSEYQNILKSRGEADAKQEALSSLGNYVRSKPNNHVLKELEERIQKDVNPDSFSVEAYRLFEEGVAAYRKRDYSNARTILEQSLKADPYNVDAWIRLGVTAYKSTEGDKKTRQQAKLKIYEQGLSYNPNSDNLLKRIEALKN